MSDNMTHKVSSDLHNLLVPIDSLVPLPNNPRKGSVEAIMASYGEFGQQKPIVVRPNDDGTATVIAGNHQAEAARRLGWSHIAAVKMEADDSRAIAFALADNRTNELGHTDPELLNNLLDDITDFYPELLDGLGWDDFELAALGEQAGRLEKSGDTGYIPPVIISSVQEPEQDLSGMAVDNSDDGPRIVPAANVDAKSVAALGSTSIGASGSNKALVQYTVVFDDSGQQEKWYRFMRWLRSDVSIDGDTFGAKLINFIDAHADY